MRQLLSLKPGSLAAGSSPSQKRQPLSKGIISLGPDPDIADLEISDCLSNEFLSALMVCPQTVESEKHDMIPNNTERKNIECKTPERFFFIFIFYFLVLFFIWPIILMYIDIKAYFL
jgi:hypothetical protein